MYIVYIYLFKFNRLCCALLALSPLSFAPPPFLSLFAAHFLLLPLSFIHSCCQRILSLSIFVFVVVVVADLLSFSFFQSNESAIFYTILFGLIESVRHKSFHFTTTVLGALRMRACLSTVHLFYFLSTAIRPSIRNARAMIKCLKLELFYYRLPFLSFIM